VSGGGFVVDADALVEGQEGRCVVAVIGEGSFRSVNTGTSWALGDLAGSAECLGLLRGEERLLSSEVPCIAAEVKEITANIK
jgi:hypothetical protein